MTTATRALPVRLLGALSLLLALLLVTGEGANAASRTVTDATGDVSSLSDGSRITRSDGDITSVTTVHQARTVRVKVRARHLSLDMTGLMAKLRTGPSGPTYFFAGQADIGMRMAIMTRGQTRFIVCPGIRMGFRPARAYVMAVIPRTCLGNPRWVQTGAALMTTDSMIKALASTDTGDDSFAAGPEGTDGTIDVAGLGALSSGQINASMPPLPLGPRVHVG